ncbi:HNH endonuclease [Priestia flexa]|uniref:HNH endonuclease n=1 Tax=Priestia flexa TaxID=86664 RepID=UPI001F46F17E|nr:HNH endonuclease [Priestia flexa]
MNKVLSIPAASTFHLIKKYHIHAFPHPRSYDYSYLVTFRKKGGIMEELYKVEKAVRLNMEDEFIYDKIQHFDNSIQNRIKNYIIERKKDFVFEKPDFMFWVLKKEDSLLHEPQTTKPYNNHVYFNYQELHSGKKHVNIASKEENNHVSYISEFSLQLKGITKEEIIETEKEQIIKSRVGQSAFKKALLAIEKKCGLCGVSDERFLISSHIKTWSQSNNQERLDVNNGLLLCPNHDALFDKGYISFADDGTILISDNLDEATKVFLNINETMNIRMNEDQRQYMKWHREKILKI